MPQAATLNRAKAIRHKLLFSARRDERRPVYLLAHELLRLADRHGKRTKNGVVIELRLSQEDLAVMIGVGRQTINRLLKNLEQDGIVTANYTSVTIQDVEALKRLRESEDPGEVSL